MDKKILQLVIAEDEKSPQLKISEKQSKRVEVLKVEDFQKKNF